jgi:ATP-dependent Lon protease
MVKKRSDKLVDNEDIVNTRRSTRRSKNRVQEYESESDDVDYTPKKRGRRQESNDDLDEDDLDEDDYDEYDDPMTNGRFIVPDTYVEYADGRIEYDPSNGKDNNDRRYKWIRDVDDETYKKYESEYNKIIDNYNERDITISDILKSNLSHQKKYECYELLVVLNSMRRLEGESEHYMNLRQHLYQMVKKSVPFTQQENNELDKFNELLRHEDDLLHKIIRSKHTDEIKLKLIDKYHKIKNCAEDDESRVKGEEWISTCLNLPTDIIELTSLYKDCASMLVELGKNLDEGIYGQRSVKERIMEIMAAMWTNSKRSRNCIVFLGSPGVGKTELARLLANSIGLPFYQISFGGAHDSSVLKGHSYTYIGSKPGEMAEALISMGVKNGILFLDELDKIIATPHGQEVVNTLLHILDYTQNSEFKDNYLHGIPIDLSKLIIIVSINNLGAIDSILKDRLPIVSFNDYTIEDKIHIGTEYLIPRILKNLNMNSSSIKYDKSSVSYIIEKSKIPEAGVRQLERNLSTIFERINLLIQLNKDKSKRMKMSYDIPKFKIPITLNKETIDVLFEEYRKEQA